MYEECERQKASNRNGGMSELLKHRNEFIKNSMRHFVGVGELSHAHSGIASQEMRNGILD